MRTFTKTLMAFAFIAFLMTSCGGGSEVCNCSDMSVAMIKEMIAAGKDKDKMTAIEKKYEPKIEKCKKLDEGKSEDEKKKMVEEMSKCSSAKEAEKLMQEFMKQQMQDLKPE